MPGILREEHKHYGIDCKDAIWATNEIKEFYNKYGVSTLSDADFAIETSEKSQRKVRECERKSLIFQLNG